MATPVQTLEAEIAGEEKAIRHLIGEQKALTSKLHREQAVLKLEQARLHALIGSPKSPSALPHGDRFPDVANFQPSVDWHAVRTAGSVRVGKLAVTKISEGTSFVDHFGPRRLREMAAQHFPHRGAYHFLHPSVSGTAQAEHFLEAAHSAGGVLRSSDIVVCDCEVTDGQRGGVVSSCVRAFAQTIATHVPSKRWLYGGGPFLRENGVTLAGYNAHWLAAYVANPAPFMVFGRARTIAWQYTDGRFGPTPRVCPGVGSCDMSIVL